MAELERELRALGATVELPPEPDLVTAVRARLAEPGRPRRFAWRPVAIAVAALAVALGIAFAVPPARSAILRFLGLQGVSVVRVEKLPPVGSGPAAFGERSSLPEAERLLGFRPVLPELSPPDAVYADLADGVLILLYGEPRARLRLTELRTQHGLIQKLATVEQRIEQVRVNGGPGLWIEGPHVVVELFRQPRLSGNVLLWEQGGLTLRLEGRLTKEEALGIARSVR